MYKWLYPWVIFYLGLSAVSDLLQTIVQSAMGAQLFWLDTFEIWFFVMSSTVFIRSVLVLMYFYHRKYWFAFATGALYFVFTVLYAICFYYTLRFHKFADYNVPLLVLSLVSSILFAISLLVLRGEKLRWLKAAGALMIVIATVFLFIFSRLVIHPGVAISHTLEEAYEWGRFAGCLIPVLFMMHFISERRGVLGDNVNAPVRRSLESFVSMAGIASFLLTLVLGVILSTECLSSIHWADVNFKRTVALAQLYEARIFVNVKGDTLRYRLLKPLDYNPAGKYPLVVSLPYGGQPGTDTIRQIEGAVAAELLTTDDNRKKYPAFIFIPNCPPGGGWGGIPHLPEADSLVFGALDVLDRQFSIDEKRRYVTGLSRGGYGTWNFICKRPEMFAAAIPVAGGGDPTLAPRAVHVAVWAFHGAGDKNVPVSGSRNMIDAIKRAGGNPKYTEYPDEGHNIWDRVSTTPGLLDWLFAQHRE